MEALNSSLSNYGSLSIGCRIRFSEDSHLHICHDAHLRIQWRQKGVVLQMFRREAEKRMVELSPNEARFRWTIWRSADLPKPILQCS